MLFRNIVFCALFVGMVSGGVSTAVQFFQVIPIIQSAEHFEVEPSVSTASEKTTHDHASHEHSAEDVWSPEDGIERTSYTLLTNILTAIGFAILVLVAIVVSQKSDSGNKSIWQQGILWGVAGYIVFFVAPAIGLPPEIPGAAAASLESRQLWWFFTVICTAIGLGGVVFIKYSWRWLLLGLLILPHIMGAPHVSTGMFEGKPSEVAEHLTFLAQQFIAATAISTAALWLTLGVMSVWSAQRYMLPKNKILED